MKSVIAVLLTFIFSVITAGIIVFSQTEPDVSQASSTAIFMQQ
jgi:hypothetical protein